MGKKPIVFVTYENERISVYLTLSSTSVESTTYKTMELQWAQRQQF